MVRDDDSTPAEIRRGALAVGLLVVGWTGCASRDASTGDGAAPAMASGESRSGLPEAGASTPSELEERAREASADTEAPSTPATTRDDRPATPDPAAEPLEVTDPPPARSRGVPVCKAQGTRSEAWWWPDGERIRWGKCKGRTARCERVGSADEGWYAEDELIVQTRCGGRKK
jgi:hypothetical protein